MRDAHLVVVYNRGKVICREEVGLEYNRIGCQGCMSVLQTPKNEIGWLRPLRDFAALNQVMKSLARRSDATHIEPYNMLLSGPYLSPDFLFCQVETFPIIRRA